MHSNVTLFNFFVFGNEKYRPTIRTLEIKSKCASKRQFFVSLKVTAGLLEPKVHLLLSFQVLEQCFVKANKNF